MAFHSFKRPQKEKLNQQKKKKEEKTANNPFISFENNRLAPKHNHTCKSGAWLSLTWTGHCCNCFLDSPSQYEGGNAGRQEVYYNITVTIALKVSILLCLFGEMDTKELDWMDGWKKGVASWWPHDKCGWLTKWTKDLGLIWRRRQPTDQHNTQLVWLDRVMHIMLHRPVLNIVSAAPAGPFRLSPMWSVYYIWTDLTPQYYYCIIIIRHLIGTLNRPTFGGGFFFFRLLLGVADTFCMC